MLALLPRAEIAFDIPREHRDRGTLISNNLGFAASAAEGKIAQKATR